MSAPSYSALCRSQEGKLGGGFGSTSSTAQTTMANGVCSRRQRKILQSLLLLTLVCGGLYGAMVAYETHKQLKRTEAMALKYQQHQEALSAQLQGGRRNVWRLKEPIYLENRLPNKIPAGYNEKSVGHYTPTVRSEVMMPDGSRYRERGIASGAVSKFGCREVRLYCPLHKDLQGSYKDSVAVKVQLCQK
ncbi:hypothetical protein NFI96_003516 [Prochilodus magdalenae]|nr:hypothetical protein NFI96_003516 [Prochilodus magdalenae]